jgi:hypothetical protein
MLSNKTLERIAQSDTTNNSLIKGLILLLRFLKKTGKNTEQFIIHLLKHSVERYGIVDRHRTIKSPSAYHPTIEQILSTTKHSGIQKETMSDEIGVDVRG